MTGSQTVEFMINGTVSEVVGKTTAFFRVSYKALKQYCAAAGGFIRQTLHHCAHSPGDIAGEDLFGDSHGQVQVRVLFTDVVEKDHYRRVLFR
jgi:hypothetical protein